MSKNQRKRGKSQRCKKYLNLNRFRKRKKMKAKIKEFFISERYFQELGLLCMTEKNKKLIKFVYKVLSGFRQFDGFKVCTI